ncbi:hypothetical protein CLAIMM_04942 isoform 1, partial [Cladophialophora immunda]
LGDETPNQVRMGAEGKETPRVCLLHALQELEIVEVLPTCVCTVRSSVSVSGRAGSNMGQGEAGNGVFWECGILHILFSDKVRNDGEEGPYLGRDHLRKYV